MATIKYTFSWFWVALLALLSFAVVDIIGLTIGQGTFSTGVLIPIPSVAQTTRYVNVPIISDGAQCDIPLEATIGTWGPQYTVICTDNDTATMTLNVPSLPGWDAGTVTLTMKVIQDAADTNNLHVDATGRCVGDGEAPAAYPAETALDITGVSGADAPDSVTSAAMTLAGTCAAGDQLQFRVQVDAGGTTTAMATLHFIGFYVAYTEA